MSVEQFKVFVGQHKTQLELSGIPQHLWNTLHKKLAQQIFDVGNVFTLYRIDYEDYERTQYDPPWQLKVTTKEGMKESDYSHIYLIDHAWTFQIQNAKKQLVTVESLRKRMASIVGLDSANDIKELSEQIFNEIWKYCDCYWTQEAENAENRIAIWYMMDEVGSAIHHSESPNFRVVPFIYIPQQVVYSVIFPIKDVDYDETVTSNFVGRPMEANDRRALLLPWVYSSFKDLDYVNEEPSPDYFLSGHIQETLPILSKLCSHPRLLKNKYKVYAEYSLVHEYLTDEVFEIVNNEEEADILWYTRHFKDFESLSETPYKFVNQFPFEYVLTIKDLLCIVCRRKYKQTRDLTKSSPPWLPVTYNLKIELTKFVSYFQHREEEGLDNHWIIKPFNLARSLDTHITNNLNYILRLPVTGPKIAQKYVENPVLFHRNDCEGKVKFDVRFVILLKSIKPLEAYIYKNFFLRFSNEPFELCDLDVYSKHFTVMNYIDSGDSLKHMTCEEFKRDWNNQYPDISWQSVEEASCNMLRDVLECSVMECPPCGISESPQSRALYAADIILEWTREKQVQPKLLEINWTPDCRRACEYYPNFFNDVFKLLFLNVTNEEVFHKL